MQFNLTTRLLTLCLFVFMGQGLAIAQDTTKKDEKLKFSCLYWEGAPAEDLFYRDKKSFRHLEFKEGSRSKSFSLDGASSFELYRKAEKPKEGQPPYDLLSKTKLPQSKKILFVVIPINQKGGVRYNVFAMDDSLKAFPAGAFRFANFSTETLLVKCGKTVKKIPARATTVIKSDKKTNGGFVPFIIGNAQGKTVFGTRIFGQPSGRELIFISPPAKKGAMPRVKFISELIAPSLPEPTP
ncbi:MAG: hypothetical protein AB8F34_11000 [Akkermansiaceae bacterium]